MLLPDHSRGVGLCGVCDLPPRSPHLCNSKQQKTGRQGFDPKLELMFQVPACSAALTP